MTVAPVLTSEDTAGYGSQGTAAAREARWRDTIATGAESRTARKNFDPQLWGPPFWATLHAMVEGLPDRPSDTERRAFEDVVRALPHLLPCESCRRDLVLTLRDRGPLDLRTRDTARAAVVQLHNHVNARLGKPVWRVADARAAFAQQLRTAAAAPAGASAACAHSCAIKLKRVRARARENATKRAPNTDPSAPASAPDAQTVRSIAIVAVTVSIALAAACGAWQARGLWRARHAAATHTLGVTEAEAPVRVAALAPGGGDAARFRWGSLR